MPMPISERLKVLDDRAKAERMKRSAVYTDGGTIRCNPSSIGGTWSWCRVEMGHMVTWDAGVLIAEDLEKDLRTISESLHGKVTNNQAELYAALRAMMELPDGWRGLLFTDSSITVAKLKPGAKRWANVPRWLRKAVEEQKNRLYVEPMHCGGHPSQEDLLRGRSKRNGSPVSGWNIFCHDKCEMMAKWYMDEIWPNER